MGIGHLSTGQSLTLVIMAVLGGVTTIAGAILGAIWVRGIPAIFGANFGILTSGLGLIVILILAPGGLASIICFSSTARGRITSIARTWRFRTAPR